MFSSLFESQNIAVTHKVKCFTNLIAWTIAKQPNIFKKLKKDI